LTSVTDATPNPMSSILSRSSRVTKGSGTKVLNVLRSSCDRTARHSVVLPVPISPERTMSPSRRRMPAPSASKAARCEALL
jgi:hypothetical protein